MPTRRGWAVLGAALLLWAAARVVGSQDLHMVAAGLAVLPFLATAFVHWNRVHLTVRRHLSSARVFAGQRVTVTLTVANRGPGTAPFLLLEDTLPPSLGKAARLVTSGIPPRREQVLSYTLACRTRGRYEVGPLTISLTDPFGLARVRMQWGQPSTLVVYPAVERVEAAALTAPGAGNGESRARQLFRSAAEFYALREYVVGDDLRRIHWRSTARMGRLMIRQDEATRRSGATVFLDTRQSALGGLGSASFERAVSAAASVGLALLRAGFAVHLGTVDMPPDPTTEDRLLETLAAITPSRERAITRALTALRGVAAGESTLVLVTGPPSGPELSALSRAGARFGRKVAVLVQPVRPAGLPTADRAELEARVQSARTQLQHARWQVCVLEPDQRLSEVWKLTPTLRRRPVPVPSS
ncbi:MAG TPA: DUF58 domain-containing protein [Actinomycetota bacterium]|nr:DUF58 domain-containing protein [Actinomycetota bacterium]